MIFDEKKMYAQIQLDLSKIVNFVPKAVFK